MDKNWLNVFRLKKFHFAVVEVSSPKERQKITQKYKTSWGEVFFPILPESFEIDTFQNADYVKKYTLALKKFMEDDSFEYLVTDEIILAAIVKREKKESFLNFLLKKNKKLILFADTGVADIFEQYKKDTIIMSQDQFNQKINYEESMKKIKERISFVYTPFSNPIGSFKKMMSDNFTE